jgi:hypothetical protein
MSPRAANKALPTASNAALATEPLDAVFDRVMHDLTTLRAAFDEKKTKQSKPQLLTTAEAATLAGVGNQQTIRNWCRTYGIGIRVRDRWQVDRALLRQLLIERYGVEHLPPGLRG